MAHFAKLDQNNVVLEVHIVSNDVLDLADEEKSGIEFLTEWSGGYSNWKQTSYNNKFRKQFAGIGFKYDAEADVFIALQPYPSWTLNENFDWIAPKPKPEGDFWYWNEQLGDWVNGEIV